MSEQEHQEILDRINAAEQTIQDLTERLLGTERVVMELMFFTGMLSNRPLTAEEEAWAKKIAEEL